MPDNDHTPIAPDHPDLTAAIAAEIVIAWEGMGGRLDTMPDITAGPGTLYRAFERLGADSNLLGIIGSYADTLTDEKVLEYLRVYNSMKATTRPVP